MKASSRVSAPHSLLRSVGVPLGHLPAVVDEEDPVTILGLIHIVGRHEDGCSSGGLRLDACPEVAPRDRIHAGGGLIQKNKAGTVNQGAG